VKRAIFLLFFLISCRTLQTAPSSETDTDTPDQEAWNATVYFVEDSLQRAVVKTGRRRHYVKEKTTRLDQGVYAEFFDETGKRSATLTAREGVIDENTRDLRVSGEVVVVSVEHGTLLTDSLRWIETERKILTDAPIRIVTVKDTITGEGFEAETSLRKWKILHNVKGLFDREDEASEKLDSKDPP